MGTWKVKFGVVLWTVSQQMNIFSGSKILAVHTDLLYKQYETLIFKEPVALMSRENLICSRRLSGILTCQQTIWGEEFNYNINEQDFRRCNCTG